MDLNKEQKEHLKGWLAEGLHLSDIHKKVISEFGKIITYMDLRFLIDDLELEFPKEIKIEEDKETKEELQEAGLELLESVTVEVDKIVHPGAAVSGRVTFSDGQKAAWHLDQTGRIGLVPATAGYQPSPEDIRTFQQELQEAIQQSGF